MKIEIHLNNGMTFTAEVSGYNGSEFSKALNDNKVSHVNIGDVVINKHLVALVMPVVENEEEEVGE